MRNEELEQILDNLDAKGSVELVRLVQEAKESIADRSSLNALVKRLREMLGDPSSDPHLLRSPYYNFLLACLLSKNRHSETLQFAEKAALQFKSQDEEYNESISYWFLGLFFFEQGQVENAREILNSAISNLTALSENTQNSGFYKDYDTLRGVLKKIIKSRDGLKEIPQPTAEMNDQGTIAESPSLKPSAGLEGHLFLPQLPTYTTVQAGGDGPIWAARSPENDHTETNELTIGDRRFHLYSVRRGDRHIALNPRHNYGWAKVEGNSMNTAQPTPIQAGNMVMFYEADDAPENTIVIASIPVLAGTAGYSFMVKRWDRANMQFISESSEPGHNPIPMNTDCRIIGIVVAVAKPS
jgi:tetratricopeptide (TPR) repeat protein